MRNQATEGMSCSPNLCGAIGHERREIPFHLVNYMDEKLRHHAQNIQNVFDEHASEEMTRYREILRKIDDNKAASEERHADLESHMEERHSALIQSIQSYVDKVERFSIAVESAFPKDAAGKTDFAGHAAYHSKLIDEAKEASEFRKYIKRVVAAAAAIASLTWIWNVVWPAIVAGPK